MGIAADFSADLSGAGYRIAIVMSRFNHAIVQGLLQNCQETLQQLGVATQDIAVYSVAGALEIPLVLQTLAKTQHFDGLIALGCVIRGDTYHFEIVCNEACAGISRVQLDHAIPIGNAILTVETEQQAQLRIVEKGVDVAKVTVEMIQLLKNL